MKKSLPRLAVSFVLLLLAGCASTKTARIQKNPEAFQSLTADQQKLIKSGKVKVGFTADMVYLALGNPSRVFTVQNPQSPKMDLWLYSRGKMPADHFVGSSLSESEAKTYEPRETVLSSDVRIFDRIGKPKSERYDYVVTQGDELDELELVFREGRLVAIRVFG